MELVLSNQVTDGWGRDEHLHGRHSPAAAYHLDQDLAHDPLKHHRHLGANLRLLMGREHIDDPIDRLTG